MSLFLHYLPSHFPFSSPCSSPLSFRSPTTSAHRSAPQVCRDAGVAKWPQRSLSKARSLLREAARGLAEVRQWPAGSGAGGGGGRGGGVRRAAVAANRAAGEPTAAEAARLGAGPGVATAPAPAPLQRKRKRR